MSDKSSALAELEAAFGELQEAANGVADEKMAAVAFGEWSAKDLVAHCASWDEFAALDLQRIARGHMPCLAAFKEAEVDSWNAFLMRPRRLFPLPQVRFESEHCHRQLLEALQPLPENLFAPGNMVAAFLAIASGHYRQHAGDIRQWRQREGM